MMIQKYIILEKISLFKPLKESREKLGQEFLDIQYTGVSGASFSSLWLSKGRTGP